MIPLTYVIIGLIVVGALAAIIFFAIQRRSTPSELLANARTAEEEIIRRLEMLDRGLRDEFSRNREEGASAAKSQREGLGNSLEEMLTSEQFAKNMKTRDDTDERVEFAIRLPGDDNGAPVWLPIDAKFPMEHYERLATAQEKGDAVAVDAAMKTLETQLKRCAKDICEKYINPPKTTDFALLFLPSEGLYAEAIRRVGLVQNVQRDCRVTFVGPTTLAALLNSLQVGFRTLAIQRRSSEVWNLLATVKTEFGKFGDALSAVKEKIDQASRKIEDVDVRSRAIRKKLRDEEELPSNPQPLLRDLLQNEDDEALRE